MDAKSFGVFLAQQRKKQGFTQAELAEQLHVTDKAVSRWERGIGLPDINTLEPLANALQMTLDELIHAEIKQERSTASAVQAFVDLFSPQSQSVWRTIRSTCFILSAALCIVALALCPGNVAIQWKVNFFAVPIAYAGKFVVFPALALLEAGTLYFWEFCDAHISLQEKHFLTWCYILHPRFAEFVKLLREAIFLFFFGFLIPFCTLMTLLLNTPHF